MVVDESSQDQGKLLENLREALEEAYGRGMNKQSHGRYRANIARLAEKIKNDKDLDVRKALVHKRLDLIFLEPASRSSGPSNRPPSRSSPGPSHPHTLYHPYPLSPIAGPSHLRPPHLPQPPPPPSSLKTEQLKLQEEIRRALWNAVKKSVDIDDRTRSEIKSYADDIDEGIDRRKRMKEVLATLVGQPPAP